MEKLYKESLVIYLNKKVKELTLEDVDKLYKQKIAILFKFINDDDYFITLEKEA